MSLSFHCYRGFPELWPSLLISEWVLHCVWFGEADQCLDGCIYTEDTLLTIGFIRTNKVYQTLTKGVPPRTKAHINVDMELPFDFSQLSFLGQIGPWIKKQNRQRRRFLYFEKERKVTGNDNMFNKTRPHWRALLSHGSQRRERKRESSRMVCVNPPRPCSGGPARGPLQSPVSQKPLHPLLTPAQHH